MKISAEAEYARLAMIIVARHRLDQSSIRIREITESHGLPER